MSLSRNIITNAATNTIQPASALVTAPLLALALGVDGRGVVAAGTAPLFLVGVVAPFGLPDALVYMFAKRGPQAFTLVRATMFWLLGSTVVGALGLWGLAMMIGAKDPDIYSLILASALALAPTMANSAMRGAAAGMGMWGAVNREKIVAGLFRALAIGVLFVAGELTVVTAFVVLAFTPAIGMFAYSPSFQRGRARSRAVVVSEGQQQQQLQGKLLRYGARVWVGSLAGVLLLRIDQVLMVPLSSTRQLGLYVVAVSLADVCLLLSNAARDVTASAHARAGSNASLARTSRLTFQASLLMGMAIAAVAPFAIPILFGPEFGGAVSVTLILVLATVIGVPGAIAGSGLSATGRPGRRSLSLGLACSVNIPLLLVLTPPYGAIGAAYATLAGNFVAANSNIVLFRRVGGPRLRDYYRFVLSDYRRRSVQTARLDRVS